MDLSSKNEQHTAPLLLKKITRVLNAKNLQLKGLLINFPFFNIYTENIYKGLIIETPPMVRPFISYPL